MDLWIVKPVLGENEKRRPNGRRSHQSQQA